MMSQGKLAHSPTRGPGVRSHRITVSPIKKEGPGRRSMRTPAKPASGAAAVDAPEADALSTLEHATGTMRTAFLTAASVRWL